ncbi:MAG: hypothetical protein WCF84_08380 [Anaerolineae bacterium]
MHGQRVDAALQIAQAALADIPGAADLVRRICELLQTHLNGQWKLWLGAELGQNEKAKYKLYWNADRQTSKSETAFESVLNAMGCTPGSQARKLIQLLGTGGYPKMLSLSFSPSGHSGVKLYYRLPNIDFTLLGQAVLTAGFALDPFASYVHQMLRVREGWSDPNAGLGIGLQEGEIEGLALYHYTRRYFLDDADLRRQVLEMSSQFQWDVSAYRASSQLIASPDERLRSLVGLSVNRTGETQLRLYARPGHLARS